MAADLILQAPAVRHLGHADLVALLRRIFERHGVAADTADILARNCAAAERDGAASHGIFRIAGYLASLASGWVDGRAVPVLHDVAPGFIRVDAGNGFAQPALALASDLLVAKARRNGVALLAIRNSHHFGALWPDVEPFAEQGLVALSFVNSFACVVPHGGHAPVFGTNPMAFAAPRAGAPPLVFDQASSALANGDVRLALEAGEPLPAGAGVDREGRPTQSPAAVLDGGALLPFGGYKGSSIAMMIEVLGAAVTGGNFSFEVDWSAHPGAETPRTGQLVLLIDPGAGGNAGFLLRLETLVTRIRDAGQERLPGDRRHARRADTLRHGIPIPLDKLQRLVELAGGTPIEAGR